jgi:hydroxymethylbilane synthase
MTATAATAGRVVIGTRGSPLARWQAEHVADRLRAFHPGLEVTLSIIVTEGDRFQAGPLIEVGGKGVWVKDIERALLEGTADLAVHSLKDVPAELAEGLALVAIPPRADPRDALVSRSGVGLAALPAGARVGTSSLRRVCQLAVARPDLAVELLRGNVDTRLRKVAEGVVDAAVLACAGLDRLGHAGRIAERIAPEVMLPAIGQGALALEARAHDQRVRALVRPLTDTAGEITVAAERALLAGLGGSCRTPLGGHATLTGDRLTVHGLVGRPDGSEILREVVEGSAAEATDLGTELARRLRARGADRILAELG